MERRIRALYVYLRGWMQYFRLARTPSVYRDLDGWVMRRLRLCLWKQWKCCRTRLPELRALKPLAFVEALKLASGKFDHRLDDGYRVDLLGIPFPDARVKRTPLG